MNDATMAAQQATFGILGQQREERRVPSIFNIEAVRGGFIVTLISPMGPGGGRQVIATADGLQAALSDWTRALTDEPSR